MINLKSKIEKADPPVGGVAFWWLAQAGFVFKSGAGTVIYLDPYLSNVVEKAFGFKRLSLAPIDAQDVQADWFISSHEHLDHLDVEALPIIAKNNPNCRFAGSESCIPEFDRLGISPERRTLVLPGDSLSLGDVKVSAARADHGELSPSALSLLLDFGEIRVMFSGDTSLNIPWMQPLLDMKPTVLITCINGKFGNLNPKEAAQLTQAANPKIVVPCHFWMFKEHNGDPEAFMMEASELCPDVQAVLMSPGEGILIEDSGAATARTV
jgi:L-ascorbate 6-phosphate lactonase